MIEMMCFCCYATVQPEQIRCHNCGELISTLFLKDGDADEMGKNRAERSYIF